jgi:beta-1,4-N-acetylglucosaminyltransferase
MQLVALREAWDGLPRVWVTFDKPDARSLLADEEVLFAFGPTNRSLRRFAQNLCLAQRLLRRLKPAAMVTTGAGVAVPFAWLARLRRIPVVYIESLTRINELSLSGRLIRPIASQFYVQWPELAETDGRNRYAGNLLGATR